MDALKTIVVATDFSKNSKIAFKYAQDLAQIVGAKVRLIHVYGIPINSSQAGFPEYIPDSEQLNQQMLKDLKKFANNPSVECEAYPGFAGDRLIEMSKTDDCDLIVVGAKGETGLFSKVFGGISALVMHKAFCPVLVIPEKVKFKGISDIIFALSKESSGEHFIQSAAFLTHVMGSKLHFVHVNNAGASTMPDIRSEVKKLDIPFEVSDLDFVSTRGGIDVYREKHNAGLIIAATHHYAFWENFSHASVTDSLIWNTEIPILVLHKEDKS